MKRLLTILLLIVSFGAMAQTYDTLPAGSKPYGNQLYITLAGDIIGGTGSGKFRVIANKKYVDSLINLRYKKTQVDSMLALKVNTSTLTNYVTKTGVETITNKTLSAPVINTPDITNGTVNSATIVNSSLNNSPVGNTSANTIRGTTITATVDVLLPSSTPNNALSAAPVAYVQNAINGLSWKQRVELATTANVALTGSQTIDGIATGTGKRILVKNQTDAGQNGVYITNPSGWVRATDASTADYLTKLTVLVGNGTTQKFTVWSSSTPVTTVGVDPVNFVQTSGPGSYLAGRNMDLTGNVFSTVTNPDFDTQATDDLSTKAANTTFVQNRLATGQTIGANTTGSAEKWKGFTFTNSEVANPTALISLGLGTDINYTTKPNVKSWLNLNDGSTLNNNISGSSSTSIVANRLNSYNGINSVYWGWNGSEFTAKVDNTDFGSTVPFSITGSAKYWGGRLAQFGAGITQVTGVLAVDNDGVAREANAQKTKDYLATTLQEVTTANNVTDKAIVSSNGTITNLLSYDVSNTGKGQVGTVSNHDLGIITNGINRIAISKDGKVGFGNESPKAKVDIDGDDRLTSLRIYSQTAAQEPGILYENVAGKKWNTFYSPVLEGFGIYEQTSGRQGYRALFRDGGNVLIGATNDDQINRLQVNGSIGALSINLRRANTTGSNYIRLGTGSTDDWFVGNNPEGTGSSNLHIYSYDKGNVAVFDKVTGNVLINNTLFGDIIRPLTGDDLTLLGGGSNRLVVNGSAKINTLAGTGSSFVGVDANGTLNRMVLNLSNYMTTNTNQAITGVNTFNANQVFRRGITVQGDSSYFQVVNQAQTQVTSLRPNSFFIQNSTLGGNAEIRIDNLSTTGNQYQLGTPGTLLSSGDIQNNLTASTTKAPSVTAVNTGLATKPNLTTGINTFNAVLNQHINGGGVAMYSGASGSYPQSQQSSGGFIAASSSSENVTLLPGSLQFINNGFSTTLYPNFTPFTQHNAIRFQNGSGLLAFTSDITNALSYGTLNKSANYTIIPTDFYNGSVYVYVNATSGGITITLPSVANTNGKKIVVFKTDNSSNAVTISGGTINQSTSYPLTMQNQSVEITSDNTQFRAR